MTYFGNVATTDDSLVLRFHGTWSEVVAWACAETDAIVDLLRSGVAFRVLILPLEILGIGDDGHSRRYTARLRVVWEPPLSRCARPDAWIFSGVGDQPVRDRILDEALSRVEDAYRHAPPPLALGPIVLSHGF